MLTVFKILKYVESKIDVKDLKTFYDSKLSIEIKIFVKIIKIYASKSRYKAFNVRKTYEQ